MTTCDHATCVSAFCPYCGCRIVDRSGSGLFVYLRERMEWECDDYELEKLSAWESWVAAHIAKDAGEEGES